MPRNREVELHIARRKRQIPDGFVRGIRRWMKRRVQASTVYDDGGGPALYLGGDFTYVHDVNVSKLARWNGTSWSAGGGGVVGQVFALAVYDDGSGPALFAGGVITNAGGVLPVSN